MTPDRGLTLPEGILRPDYFFDGAPQFLVRVGLGLATPALALTPTPTLTALTPTLTALTQPQPGAPRAEAQHPSRDNPPLLTAEMIGRMRTACILGREIVDAAHRVIRMPQTPNPATLDLLLQPCYSNPATLTLLL